MNDDKEFRNLKRSIEKKVILYGFLVATLLVGSVVAIFLYHKSELSRAEQEWQVRLSIVADSRRQAVSEWIDGNFQVLRDLAENASLQLYMATANNQAADITEKAAQIQFLNNLLTVRAELHGFTTETNSVEVNSNVAIAGSSGIALVGKDGKLIAASPQMPALTASLIGSIAPALEGQATFIDFFLGGAKQPTLGFALPVYGIQDDRTEPLGAVVALKIPDKALFGRLRQPGDTQKSAETYIVREKNNLVEYLTPTQDISEPLERKLALDSDQLIAAWAIQVKSGYTERLDYAGARSLAVARQIGETPWVLVRKISRDEALSEIEGRLQILLIGATGFVGLVTLLMLAVWRHGSSVRATQAAERQRIAAERFENMSKFMRVITDSAPSMIFALDRNGQCTFANKAASDRTGIASADMLQKNIKQLLGPIQANYLIQENVGVLDHFEALEGENEPDAVAIASRKCTREFQSDDPDENLFFKSSHVPLRGDRDFPPAVLTIIDDVSEIVQNANNLERNTTVLLRACLDAIDRGIPIRSGLSTDIAVLSEKIARKMDLEERAIRNVTLASLIMNIGAGLSDELYAFDTVEWASQGIDIQRKIRQFSMDILSLHHGSQEIIHILEHIGAEFDPALDSDPERQKMCIEAQIITVADAFCCHLRGYEDRSAADINKIFASLLEQGNTTYSRSCIGALMSVYEVE